MEFRKNTDYEEFMDHHLDKETQGFEETIPEAEYDALGDYDLEKYIED